MPLHIIRQDITQMKCDAIVNAANETLLGGGGVDGAIHKAAGEELLSECKTLGGCKTGQAKITKGYNLPAKYVIHTVGPIWEDGKHGEREKLISCYKNSLELAKSHGCQTVAFPLISAGVYGYPKAEAFSVAVNTIGEFLMTNEMTVYIIVFDKDSFNVSGKLFNNVLEYIDDNYAQKSAKAFSRRRNVATEMICGCAMDAPRKLPKAISNETSRLNTLEQMLKNIDECFSVTLLKLIDIKGMSDVECYKKANVSKQTWYKIMNDKSYKPSKNTVIAFAIALKLSYEETQNLLSTVGYALSKSSVFDIIIEYFLIVGEYDIFKINQTLFDFDQSGLGL